VESDISIGISVIIVNYNSGDRLKRCLDCLAVQTLTPAEIIVIDNASSDESMENASRANVVFRKIDAGSNLGFAVANNVAVKEAEAPWVAFLNPDAYAAPEWLASVAAGISNYPWADAFGSLQIDYSDETTLDGAGDVYFFAGIPYRGHFGWPRETAPADGECFAPCAAAAIYRRSVFETLGGFEESFFCYGEDVDLGFRLRLAGKRAVQLSQAIVRHEGSGITGRRSEFTTYHGHRNRIWTYVRNMPAPILIISLPVHFLVNLYLAVRFSVNGQLRPYLRAVKDAVLGLSAQWKARKKIQLLRQASTGDIAKALSWSPVRVARRQEDLKPIRDDSRE